MRAWRRVVLWLLELLERMLGDARERLRQEREQGDEMAIRLTCGGWPDGAWVRVHSNECVNCVKDHPVGSVHRVKRFTTEARSYGEWVFDRPRTSFCCASGVVLASAPIGMIAAAEEAYRAA